MADRLSVMRPGAGSLSTPSRSPPRSRLYLDLYLLSLLHRNRRVGDVGEREQSKSHGELQRLML